MVSTSGTLPVGSYALRVPTAAPTGTQGTWTYTLDVTAGTLPQFGSGHGGTTPGGSAAFTDQLAVTDSLGAVTFAVTSPSAPAGLSVSPAGAVSTTGTLAVGSYAVSGTDRDAEGDTGTWSYTLEVTAPASGARRAPRRTRTRARTLAGTSCRS